MSPANKIHILKICVLPHKIVILTKKREKKEVILQIQSQKRFVTIFFDIPYKVCVQKNILLSPVECNNTDTTNNYNYHYLFGFETECNICICTYVYILYALFNPIQLTCQYMYQWRFPRLRSTQYQWQLPPIELPAHIVKHIFVPLWSPPMREKWG